MRNSESKTACGLGIDAGGTFTDAVILPMNGGGILARTKAPTTRPDPVAGIRSALDRLPEEWLSRTEFVSLATTFATNAIVEGRGGKAGLVLIGYDRDHPGLSRMSPRLFIGGGHNYWGEEKDPLDRKALRDRLASFAEGLEAVAVSSFFSIRNPAHELEAAQTVSDVCGLPTVCGHALSGRLDAPLRAATAWWNARLIPLIRRLIDAAGSVLSEFGIQAPFMVVRGDGTLMSADEARRRPVDTLVSGPAAGIIGARYLSGLSDGVVADMGGTTTDMAVLRGGRVQTDPEGATVGGWRTHVAAARIRTSGLGGDSLISAADGTHRTLTIGPERVEPLCILGARHPEIADVLKNLVRFPRPVSLRSYHPCSFYWAAGDLSGLPESIRSLLEAGPVNEYLLLSGHPGEITGWSLRRLADEGRLFRASLTPTDFCAVSGRYSPGNSEASRRGAALFAHLLDMDADTLFRAVKDAVSRRFCLETAALLSGQDASAVEALQHRWFPRKPLTGTSPDFQMELRMNLPVIGIGAPAGAWMPEAFAHVHTSCILPEHYMVGTAVGAAAGVVDFLLEAEVRPVDGGGYQLYSPEGPEGFAEYESAVKAGRAILEKAAGKRMAANFVKTPRLVFSADKRCVPVPGGELFLCTKLELRATGRMDVEGEGHPE